MPTFLITGMGKSGTKFLASAMNQLSTWAVSHEPIGPVDIDIENESAIRRFRAANKENIHYGEVNSYLRGKATAIPCQKLGVIVRKPTEILQAVAKKYSPPEATIRTIDGCREVLNLAKHPTCDIISFYQMVRDSSYLLSIIKSFTGESFTSPPSIRNGLEHQGNNCIRLNWFSKEELDAVYSIEREMIRCKLL